MRKKVTRTLRHLEPNGIGEVSLEFYACNFRIPGSNMQQSHGAEFAMDDDDPEIAILAVPAFGTTDAYLRCCLFDPKYKDSKVIVDIDSTNTKWSVYRTLSQYKCVRNQGVVFYELSC